jgi:multiple sugar transport system ATP-binding protein
LSAAVWHLVRETWSLSIVASIRLEHIEKTFPNGHVAARDLNLEIADGEFMVLVGPSGCGKSTVLRLVAGLEMPTQGRLWIGGRDVTDLPPQERDVAMVFQNYALYPHKTVRGNLEFGLRMRRTDPAVIAERVGRVADILGIATLLDRKPAQLSGGQRQRVALGRAIVREPRAFLLDEPLSNLDAKLRIETRAELSRMHRQLVATMLYVTHDQEEAVTLGDRVTVLRDGQIEQVAPPMELYNRPATVFVGGFIGSPSMSFFPCTLRRDNGKTRLEGRAFSLDMDAAHVPLTTQSALLLGVRPNDIELVEPAHADARARVDVIQLQGSETVLHLKLLGKGEEMSATAIVPAGTKLYPDSRVGIRFPRERLHLFDAHSARRID